MVGDPRGLTVDGVPVAVLRVGRDLPDPRGVIRRAYRLGAESAVLVRPDGVVAWRHDGAADPAALVVGGPDGGRPGRPGRGRGLEGRAGAGQQRRCRPRASARRSGRSAGRPG